MSHAIVEFSSGVARDLEANWAATGRTMDLSFEITGSKGAASVSQENMNELRLYSGSGARAGYARNDAGLSHPPYGRFFPRRCHASVRPRSGRSDASTAISR